MENKSATPPIKKRQPKKERPPILEDRLIELEKWRENVRKDLESIRNVRLELAEFIFQTVAIIIGIFAVIITVFLAISTNFRIEQESKQDIMLLFLGIIASFAFIWLINWIYTTFIKKR